MRPKSKLLVMSFVLPKLKASFPGKSLLKFSESSPTMNGGIVFPSGPSLLKSIAGKAESWMGESFLLEPAREKSFSGEVESAAGSQRSQSSQSSLLWPSGVSKDEEKSACQVGTSMAASEQIVDILRDQ